MKSGTAIYSAPVSLGSTAARDDAQALTCVHCGLDCPPYPPRMGDKVFCCHGCRTVFQLLSESGMDRFYSIEQTPGVRPMDAPASTYATLDQPEVRRRLVDFSNGKITRITFRIPAMHCAACVWLLENLYRLVPGVGRSEVNFPRKELAIFIEDEQVNLSSLATRLAQLGYAPELKLDRLSGMTNTTGHRRLLLQLGVAGFAFGNIMMMSFPSYLGLDPVREASLFNLFTWASLLLAIPVLLFSARDFYRGAWLGLKQRTLTIEFPLALGISALFVQSFVDILRQSGEGYLDSFSGLVFLLLCGKWFQRRTYDALAFDRDYRSYFPLSVTRIRAGREEAVALTELKPGDRVVIRHGELAPADAILMKGRGLIDYSFVTGESSPSAVEPGDYLYAGGRQTGGVIEAELVKDVSQSYLTSLWNKEAFRKPREHDLQNLTNLAGRWFTAGVVVVAALTALYWWRMDPAMMARTFAAVLIVACPCALALAAPYTFSTAQRYYGKAGLFVRSPSVVEAMAKTRDVIFDKTGTLTHGSAEGAIFDGAPLMSDEMNWIRALTRQSSHPASRAIIKILGESVGEEAAESYVETAGAGISGNVAGHRLRIGAASWLGITSPDSSGVWVEIDGRPRGRFMMGQEEREGLTTLMERLRLEKLRLALLSGDRPAAAPRFRELFGRDAALYFEQSPHDKLEFVRQEQAAGRRVLMIGDGLNDAGALRQSDVGIAVSDDVTLFSPACDAILAGHALARLPEFIRFARFSVVVLKSAFAISLIYNVSGIAFAASGALSPLVSAILMPLSSFSVIAFSLLATSWAAHRTGVAS